MAARDIHHRTELFRAIFRETVVGVQKLLESETDPILLAGSATAGMDAILQNLFFPGEPVIVCSAGSFGKRWVSIAQGLALTVTEVTAPLGSTFSLESIEETLKCNPGIKGLCIQYCETSTTVLHPVREIGGLLKRYAPDALYIVDAVTAAGVLPIEMGRSEIDAIVIGSQKALMLPPGLAAVALSSRAWKQAERRNSGTYYLNLLRERAAQAKDPTAYTPAVTLIAGLHECLKMLEEEGLPAVYARHERLSAIARSGLTALGFRLLASDCPSPGVTGGYPPDGIEADKLRSHLLNRYGVRLAGGQGELKGKIVRLGHMGYFDEVDVLGALAAVELSVRDLGFSNYLGAGMLAALKA